MRRFAKRGQIVQRVVAVAGTLTADDHPRLPVGRRPEELPLGRCCRARIQVVARNVVYCEAIALGVTQRETYADPVPERSGHVAADLAGVVVTERHGQPARPLGERRARAEHVHQPAERIAAEKRALRAAGELHLLDVHKIHARRVRVQMRHAIDERRDRGICRARAEAAKTGIHELPCGEIRVKRVR